MKHHCMYVCTCGPCFVRFTYYPKTLYSRTLTLCIDITLGFEIVDHIIHPGLEWYHLKDHKISLSDEIGKQAAIYATASLTIPPSRPDRATVLHTHGQNGPDSPTQPTPAGLQLGPACPERQPFILIGKRHPSAWKKFFVSLLLLLSGKPDRQEILLGWPDSFASEYLDLVREP